jgi:hypothetical protein
MIFLPASFIAVRPNSFRSLSGVSDDFLQSVFGMNVREIIGGATETLAHYAMVSVSFTVLTAWLVVAFQVHSPFHEPGSGFWRRLAWPVTYVVRPTGLQRALRSQPVGAM